MKGLEEEFYHVFEIEPTATQLDDGSFSLVYPPITSDILLELICKLSGVYSVSFAFERNPEDIRCKVLSLCIEGNKYLKNQVRSVFRGAYA